MAFFVAVQTLTDGTPVVQVHTLKLTLDPADTSTVASLGNSYIGLNVMDGMLKVTPSAVVYGVAVAAMTTMTPPQAAEAEMAAKTAIRCDTTHKRAACPQPIGREHAALCNQMKSRMRCAIILSGKMFSTRSAGNVKSGPIYARSE